MRNKFKVIMSDDTEYNIPSADEYTGPDMQFLVLDQEGEVLLAQYWRYEGFSLTNLSEIIKEDFKVVIQEI